MTQKATVLESVNGPGDAHCVDIFRRTDGSFGFEEYRRDPEDGRGWFAVGGYAAQQFDSAEAARTGALDAVIWLAERHEMSRL